MWSELYINDPDILSDVTEIAVKKLGYWIERRLREGRSSSAAHFYLCMYIHCTRELARARTHTRMDVYVYADRSLRKVVLKRALVSRIFRLSDSMLVSRSSETPRGGASRETRARVSRDHPAIEILGRTPNVYLLVSRDLRP